MLRREFPKINDIIDDPSKDVYGETIGERFLESIKRRKGLLGIQHGCVGVGGGACVPLDYLEEEKIQLLSDI